MRRLLTLLILLVVAKSAAAQSADNVLLVVNDESPASIRIGEAYAGRREVPHEQVFHLKTAITDGIDRTQYLREIEGPIATYLASHALQDRILYIVLTKGVPLSVNGPDGLGGTTASVDSELTLLYRRLAGLSAPIEGRLPNPYFLGDRPLSEAKPFTRFTSDTYLVTRLDGFTVEEVLKSIDRSVTPAHEGAIVLDEKATLLDRGGDAWLKETATRLADMKVTLPVILETTKALAASQTPVIAYYSWGSNDPAEAHVRHLGLPFAAGSIGGTFVSTDGRTFSVPPDDWTPSGPDGGPVFSGSFQSLAGDLIHDGLTGVSAHVSEPYLDATIRPQILIPAYVSGFNLAESFYLAMPYLSWKTVIVGDPLCAPFARPPLAAAELYKGVDADTGLPALFAARRLALLTRTGASAEAAKLVLKFESQKAQGQTDIEPLLAKAAELDPRFTLNLALYHDGQGNTAKAMEEYRRVIALDAENAVALNNLAYDLDEVQHAPKEALPFAERAARLSTAANVLDTLGWTRHLTGDDRGAAMALEHAVAAAPDDVDILVHSAIVHAALDNKARAKSELDKAESLNPEVKNRPEVKDLHVRIGGTPLSQPG
jgi:uncharacterized protein (TIGR03790 family)